MLEERLKLAVFIDFDNIQIGVKDTLGKDFDVAVVLEALKERGEIATKIAYGDWSRAGEQSRQLTQHAVQMVQRNVTPRGDKNGADINLALDALEMAFTRHHITGFAIVGGDSDFIALVEKLKQYDKQIFVVGGRAFTSQILQRNCTEFIAYENLLGGDTPRAARALRRGRSGSEPRALREALPNVQRALKILGERSVAPQIGLLKSTLLQLDSTFSERDFGAGSFLEFMEKMARAGLVRLRRTDRGFLVEPADAAAGSQEAEAKAVARSEPLPEGEGGTPSEGADGAADSLPALRQALAAAGLKAPNRPLYLRQVRQVFRSADKKFDERQYGPRGVLELLQRMQREGWVRLQRDRKGVLRIFPIASSAVSQPSAFVADPQAAVPAEVAASTDSRQRQEFPTLEETPGAHQPQPAEPEAVEAVLPASGVPGVGAESEPAVEGKVRRARTAATKKGSRRKTLGPRRAKEPSAD